MTAPELHVRRAGPLDCTAISAFLAMFIRAQDHADPPIPLPLPLRNPPPGEGIAGRAAPHGAALADHLRADPRRLWHLAEDAGGQVLGLQIVEPDADPATGHVATLTRPGGARTPQRGPDRADDALRLGIGAALFARSRAAARAAGYARLLVTLPAGQGAARSYYQSRGFEPAGHLPDGDRVVMAFDLD